ncbi:hypothetical protein ES703_118984 [subsurface metagenome]
MFDTGQLGYSFRILSRRIRIKQIPNSAVNFGQYLGAADTDVTRCPNAAYDQLFRLALLRLALSN